MPSRPIASSDPLTSPISASPPFDPLAPPPPPPPTSDPTPEPRQRRPHFTTDPPPSSNPGSSSASFSARPPGARRVSSDGSTRAGGRKAEAAAPPADKVKVKETLGQRVWRIAKGNGVIQLDWIPGKLNRQALKPVIRCALAVSLAATSGLGWIAMLLILIGPTQKVLGQASFFVLVVAFITPPEKAFIQVLEVHFYSIFFVAISWLWVVIAAAIVSAVRKEKVPKSQVVTKDIYSGVYLEANVSIVCAVFLGVGSAFFCWLKVKTAPSAITFPCVFACIQMDVAFTLIPLVPYDYFDSGKVFFIPLVLQVAVNLVLSLVVFPSSVSANYLGALQSLINPAQTATAALLALFESGSEGDASLDDWIALGEVMTAARAKSQTEGLGVMMGMADCLKADFSLGRVSPEDLNSLGEKGKDVVLRAGGVAFFFEIIQTALRHTHLDSQAFSVRTHRGADFDEDHLYSRPGSAHTSPHESPSGSHNEDLPASAGLPTVPHPSSHPSPLFEGLEDHTSSARHSPLHPYPDSDDSHHTPLRPSSSSWRKKDLLHLSLGGRHGKPRSAKGSGRRSRSRDGGSLHGAGASHLSLFEKLTKSQQPVGVWESQRYMDVENSLARESTEHIHQQLHLLAHSSIPLVSAVNDALRHASEWSTRINSDRSFFSSGKGKRGAEFELENDKVVKRLQREIEEYRERGRLEVLDPYKHLFDPSHPPPDEEQIRKIPHRDLYWCYMMQFTLLAYSNAVLGLSQEVDAIERLRPAKKLWLPKLRFPTGLFTAPSKDSEGQGDSDEDPEKIPGLEPRSDSVGGSQVQQRDPDSLAPETPFLFLVSRLHHATAVLTSTQFLFAIKAGVLTVLVATPAWTPATAGVFQNDRGLWALIMAQLTLALYSGETAMAWVGRVTGTFAGCVVGLLIWTIGAGGSGRGTPYGMGAACAVAFPIVTLFRLYYPGPPLTRIIFTVSQALVVGYGWQNAHGIALTDVKWGWDVSWRRFLLVLIGITAAWIWSSVPPTASGKQSLRHSYARMISTIGDGMCAILSEADEKIADEKEHARIEQNLISMKRKLNGFGLRHHSMSYELSLRGVWPLERYEALKGTLMDLTALLSQLQFVLTTLTLPWRRALLKRTRLMDVRFLGDILAVISLCSTCLRSATPLPQITPCPLIERYLERHHGLRIEMGYDEMIHHSDEEEGGVPRHVTAEVLESVEYMNFAVGCATAFAIVGRWDRLMVISKTLLGETFHIDGIRTGNLHV